MMKSGLPVASLLALAALATSASFVHAADAVSIDCISGRLPSQRAVADLLGTHNFSQIYAERTRLMQLARSQCQRGSASTIRIVSAPPTPLSPIALEAGMPERAGWNATSSTPIQPERGDMQDTEKR